MLPRLNILILIIIILIKASIPQKIISSLSIEPDSLTIPLTFYDEDQYNTTLTKITISANNLCFIAQETNIKESCFINQKPLPKSAKEIIYLVDNEELLKKIFFTDLPDHFYCFKAIIFSSALSLGIFQQSLTAPLFLTDKTSFEDLRKIITKEQMKVFDTNDSLNANDNTSDSNSDDDMSLDSVNDTLSMNTFKVKIHYDNTDSLLPYTYIFYAKFFPFFSTSIVFITFIKRLIKSKCRTKQFGRLFIFLTFMKYLFSTLYFCWLRVLLTYESTVVNTALQCVFDILMGIVNSICLTIYLTFVIMCSFGFGILYPSFSRDQVQIFFLLFIILYLFISSDGLFDYIEYKVFQLYKISEIKNMIIIAVITIVSLMRIRYNMLILREKMCYSFAYVQQHYYQLKAKFLLLKRMNSLIMIFVSVYYLVLIFYQKYYLSEYFDMIKRVNKITINEIFYIFFSIIILEKEELMSQFDINIIDTRNYNKGNLYKCIIDKEAFEFERHCTMNVKKNLIKKNLPILVLSPRFDIGKSYTCVDVENIQIGIIKEI